MAKTGPKFCKCPKCGFLGPRARFLHKHPATLSRLGDGSIDTTRVPEGKTKRPLCGTQAYPFEQVKRAPEPPPVEAEPVAGEMFGDANA